MRAFHAVKEDAASAIPALVKPLNDGECSETAAFILADIGPAGMGPLTNALKNGDWRVRASVMIGLGRFAKPFYPNPQNPVRPEDIDSFGKIIVPVLVNSLKDPDFHVRGFAAMSLGWFAREPEIAIPALTSLLSEENESNREKAAHALAQFGDKARSSVPALLQALKKEQGYVGIGNAIKRIDPEAAAKAGITNIPNAVNDSPTH